MGPKYIAKPTRTAKKSKTKAPPPPRRHEAVAPPRRLTAALVGLGLGDEGTTCRLEIHVDLPSEMVKFIFYSTLPHFILWIQNERMGEGN